MSALHVRDVPPEVVEALRRRAKRHHRSLQGELRELLASIAALEAPSHPLPRLDLHTSTAENGAVWSRTSIYGDDAR